MSSNFEEKNKNKKRATWQPFVRLKHFLFNFCLQRVLFLLLRPFISQKLVFDERHLSSFFSFLTTSSSFSLFSPSALKGHQDLLLLRCLVFVVYVDFKFPLTDSLEHEKANNSFFLCHCSTVHNVLQLFSSRLRNTQISVQRGRRLGTDRRSFLSADPEIRLESGQAQKAKP